MNHMFATAEMIGEKILAFTKSSTDAYWLAQIYYAAGNKLRGAHLLRSREDHKRSLKCKYMAGLCLFGAQKFDEALEVLDDTSTLIVDDNTSSDADTNDKETSVYALISYLRGQVLTLQNNFEPAKEAFIEAITIDARCYEAFNQLISHQLLSPKDKFKLLANIDFTNLGSNADLIRALYMTQLSKVEHLKLYEDAANLLANTHGLSDKNSADLALALSDVFYAQCRFKDCATLCAKAVKSDPYNYKMYLNYLSSLHELGETSTIYELSHFLADNAPDEPISWLAVGVYYMSTGNVDEARHYFSKASIMDPYFAQAWIGFAHTFAQDGEHDQAITAYTTAARLFPGSHMPYLFLGMQHLHLNNLQLAESYLSTARSICDRDPLLLNEQGVVCYHKNDLEKAKELFEQAWEQAVELGSDLKTWVSIKVNLGYVHRRMRNFELSLKYFEEVTREAPLEASTLSALGLLYLQMGNVSKAVSILNVALSISNLDPVASDLLNRAIQHSTESFSVETLPMGQSTKNWSGTPSTSTYRSVIDLDDMSTDMPLSEA